MREIAATHTHTILSHGRTPLSPHALTTPHLSAHRYYNTETKSQTWIKPEEIQKLDDVKAAAEAANEARGC